MSTHTSHPVISKELFVALLEIAGYSIIKEEPGNAPLITRFDLYYPEEIETHSIHYIDAPEAKNAEKLLLFIISNVKDRAFYAGGISRANAIKSLLNL